MNVVQAGRDQIQLVSSESTEPGDKDLMKVSYKRVQKNSPEFATVYESTDQSVDVQLSTFIFHAAPEPVVSLYDFIMTTFVPQTPEQPVNKTPSATTVADDGESSPPVRDTETIRVSVRLDSVQGQCFQCLVLNHRQRPDGRMQLCFSTTSVAWLLFLYLPRMFRYSSG
jgi:vacuolar protein sorting-associated protein 13A/C